VPFAIISAEIVICFTLFLPNERYRPNWRDPSGQKRTTVRPHASITISGAIGSPAFSSVGVLFEIRIGAMRGVSAAVSHPFLSIAIER
jgi:hypothetical protein